MKTISQRHITAEIQLSDDPLSNDVPNRYLTLSGHRIICDLISTGGDAQAEAHIKIYGLSLTDMNNMTVVGSLMNQIRLKNRIQINAGTDENNLPQVFSGVIFEAYADLNSAPDAPLVITAYSAMGAALPPIAGTSPQTSTASVSAMMKNYAAHAGWDFIDGGVKGTLSYPAYSGSILDQIKACARDANINWTVENNILKISPIYGNFDGDNIPPVVSPSNGMVGYPILSSSGVNIKMLFNPDIRLGHQFRVEGSQIKAVNKLWTANHVTHEIESRVPNGRWFTVAGAFANGS